MNVYDFDNTIYRGDSSVDFYLFCLRRNPRILKVLPVQASAAIRFYCKPGHLRTQEGKTAFKQSVYRYFSLEKDMTRTVEDFWNCHVDRIKDWYLNQQDPEDVVISASPEFLVAPACERLGIRFLLGSEVEKTTGIYHGLNCHGPEKVRRFRQSFPSGIVDAFYSDSLSDTPMAELAKQAYLVKGNRRLPWPRQYPGHFT